MTYDQLNTALTKLVSAARDMDAAHRMGTAAEVETAEYLRIRDSILKAFEEKPRLAFGVNPDEL
jgi:hypothetical protein